MGFASGGLFIRVIAHATKTRALIQGSSGEGGGGRSSEKGDVKSVRRIQLESVDNSLIKKKTKFSSYIGKFR